MTCTITGLELDEGSFGKLLLCSARFGHLSWHTQMLSELEDHCIGCEGSTLSWNDRLISRMAGNMYAKFSDQIEKLSSRKNTAEAASMKLRLLRKRSHRANSRYEFIDSNDNAKRMNLHSCLDGIISEAIAVGTLDTSVVRTINLFNNAINVDDPLEESSTTSCPQGLYVRLIYG
ncbi:Enhancer of polycomb [Trichinella pseudospiralis]